MPEMINVNDIIYREDLYPRIKPDAVTIQKYAENIEFLPPIEINQNKELIDGAHRWRAHQKMEVDTIAVIITETASDAELLTLAIQRNATHGLQLSNEDKRKMAVKIYAATPEKERKDKKKELSDILSISPRTLYNWLRDIDKAANETRDGLIFDMHLACRTQEEVAETVGLTVETISKKINVIQEMENIPKSELHASKYELDDDSLPKFTVWAFGGKTNKVGHFGNTEQTIVDWLLYLYTKPFDIVLDPFAGGGATVDVCQKRLRRYWASDRKPIIERSGDIRQHDLIDNAGSVILPDLRGRWSDVRLIYLDPPYWKQAHEKYSDDKADFANMDVDEFHNSLVSVIKKFQEKAPNAYVALIIQPTQWNAPNKEFTDHLLAIAPQIKTKIETRIQSPYQKANCTPPMYDWADKQKQLLVLSREIVVWRSKNG